MGFVYITTMLPEPILLPKKRALLGKWLLLAASCLAIVACILLSFFRKPRFPYVGQWAFHIKGQSGGTNTHFLTHNRDGRWFVTSMWAGDKVRRTVEASYRQHGATTLLIHQFDATNQGQQRKGVMTSRITPQQGGQILLVEPIRLVYYLDGKRETEDYLPLKIRGQFHKVTTAPALTPRPHRLQAFR